MLRKLLCWILGHKQTLHFDPAAGDAVLGCSRCHQALKDPELIYPEDLPDVTIPFQAPAPRPAVSGEVVCSQCGAAWTSHHQVPLPVLCSDCRK